MRALYWILSAGIGLVGAAWIASRRKRRAFAAEFLAALRSGDVTIDREESGILGAGVRGDHFRGIAAGSAYAFRAAITADNTRHAYVLAWTGKGMIHGAWNALKDDASSGLREIHLELIRLRGRRDGGLIN